VTSAGSDRLAVVVVGGSVGGWWAGGGSRSAWRRAEIPSLLLTRLEGCLGRFGWTPASSLGHGVHMRVAAELDAVSPVARE